MDLYGELHCHDEWSLLDGVAPASAGAQRAAELGHPFLAKTNHGNLSGVIHHIRACLNKDASGNAVRDGDPIMPIVAVEAYYRPRRISKQRVDEMRKAKRSVEEFWPYYHMVIIAKNARGWRSLKLLTSEAYRSGFYRYPCIDDELLDKWNDGIIISTSCIAGYIPQMILQGNHEAVADHIAKLNRWVGDDWYWELQPHDFDDLRAVNLEIPKLAVVTSKPVVATKDAHFPEPDWHDTQDVSVLMRTRMTFADREKARQEKGDDYYDLTAPETCYIGDREDTRRLFHEYHPNLERELVERALRGPGEIANRCTPFLIDKSPKIPRYMRNPDESNARLRELVFQGLRDLGHGDDPAYTKQAEHELKILADKDFADFFLITWDFVRWARSTDPLPPLVEDGVELTGDRDPFYWATEKGGGRNTPILISVRGSAGGSVVSYALRIITINPITWKLRFERFLNPDREGLPDIDLDFAPGLNGADLVKEYIKRKWGRNKAYDMVAHGTMAAKAAVKRVSIVHNVPHQEVNAVTKQIGKEQNDEPLAELRQVIKDLDRFFDRHPDVFKHACRLQKQIGTISEHAAGVVLSDRPLDELMPVMKKSVDDDYMVTAFGEAAETQIVSSLGFLKLDLLVIIELAKLAYAVELIGQHYDQEVALDKLSVFEDPRDVDQKVMALIRRGLLQGVFQLGGSSGIMALTKKMQPEDALHLCAINAVYRPATLATGVAEDFVERRLDPSKIDYWDPSVIPILEETYGMMIYQEQVMDIMVTLGGFSPARADAVRKVMSKWYRAKGDIAEQKLGAHREDFISNAATIVAGRRPAAEKIWHRAGGFSGYSFNKSHAGQYACVAYADAWIKTYYPDCFYAAQLTFPPAKIRKPEERKPFYEKTLREARLLDVSILPPDVNESGAGFTITRDGLRFGLESINGLGPKSVEEIVTLRPFSSFGDLEARSKKCNAGGRKALGRAGALDRWGVRDVLTEEERIEGEQAALGIVLSGEDKVAPVRAGLEKKIHTQAEVEEAPHGAVLVVGGEIIGGKEIDTRVGTMLKLDVAFGSDEYSISVSPWVYGDKIRALIDEDVPVIIRGTKDKAYECVSLDAIERAVDVVEVEKPSTNGAGKINAEAFS